MVRYLYYRPRLWKKQLTQASTDVSEDLLALSNVSFILLESLQSSHHKRRLMNFLVYIRTTTNGVVTTRYITIAIMHTYP